MILFDTVRWKNFLSYGDEWTELNLAEYSTNLVIGENGVGKSVLTEVMSFVLYGKPFRKINKPQLINSINNSNLDVELTFAVNNHKYKIVRGMKPNKFEVWEDGELLNQDAKSNDYQVYLENDVLSMNYITFTQLIVLGKATHTPFMQLPVMKRREMIEHLLGISVFYDIKSLLKEKLKTIIYDRQVANDKLELQNEKLTMNERYKKNTSEDKQKIINEYLNSISNKEDEIRLLVSENKDLTDYTAQLKTQFDDGLDGEIDKHKNRQRDILNKIKGIEKNSYFFQVNDECPTCTQTINDDIKHECIENNNTLLKKLKIGETINDAKLIQLSEMLDTNVGIRDTISVTWNTINSNNSIHNRLKLDIKELELSIKKYDSDDIDAGDILADIEKNKKDIVKFKSRIKKYDEAIEYYKIMAVILNDDGVKSLIIKKYLPLFNRDINNYLHTFGLNVKFILDEQFNEIILSRGRDNFSYNSFSEGQKLRIDLALMMSFRNLCKIKNSVDSNLLIMDEIFDSSLNQQGVDAFVDMLTEQKDINTFIITHTPEKIQDRFENTIEVVLLNNFSELKKEIHDERY